MTATTATPATAHVPESSDFGRLLAQVRDANLLDRSVRLYLPRLATTGVLVAGGVVLLLVAGDSWWQLLVAAYTAVVFTQIGFLGHDAGHQQIFRRRRDNDRFGLILANLCVGLSYSWWVDKHGRHHRSPNEPGRDPDVARNVLAWTREQAAGQRGVLALVARHQAVLFFPLLLLEALNLHVGSVRALLAAPRRHARELALLGAHAVGLVTVLLLVMSPLHALAFVGVQQAAFGLYLGCSFAPNHKGMRIVDDGERLDFLRRQVLTSRNVSGGRAVAAALGSLNYQIEHHLFPSMPSRNLRRARPLVRRFCADNGVSYAETSLLRSYAQALRYLRALRPVVTG